MSKDTRLGAIHLILWPFPGDILQLSVPFVRDYCNHVIYEIPRDLRDLTGNGSKDISVGLKAFIACRFSVINHQIRRESVNNSTLLYQITTVAT